ncbi:hypothetical protein BH11PLA2_BH11PLA2_22170 [soil metagenome]
MTVLTLLLVFAAADETVKPKLPLGKDTTFVEGPLTKEGYVNYEAALNERLSKGIKPENNANVLLWKAMGPKPEGGNGMHPDYFKALGMTAPPEKGEYLFSNANYYREHHKDFTQEQQDKFFDVNQVTHKRPWNAKQNPERHAWLMANEKPLAVVLEAVKQPDYYNPIFSPRRDNDTTLIVAALLPIVQKSREFASLLLMRAMLELDAKQYDDAWRDIYAVHRLARLQSRGATLIELLYSFAIESMANQATLVYLEATPLTAVQIQSRWKELAALPASAPIADKVNLCERFLYLDSVQNLRKNPKEFPSGERKLSDDELKALESIDWTPVLRDGNIWYDKMVKGMTIADRAERMKALKEIDEELHKRNARFKDESILNKAFTTLDITGKSQLKRTGEMLIGQVIPAAMKVQQDADRREQNAINLELAFALEAYFAEHQKYPAKLDDLAPKFIKKVPDDLFSGKALIYKPNGKDYQFYSVGVNGKDDGGRSFDDEPRGDDLIVRMPLPALKK